jgi:hypothetical protein
MRVSSPAISAVSTAGRQRQGHAADRERLGDRVVKVAAQRSDHVLARGQRDTQRDLVAAQAGDESAAAEALRQPLGQGPQDGVAGRMAQPRDSLTSLKRFTSSVTTPSAPWRRSSIACCSRYWNAYRSSRPVSGFARGARDDRLGQVAHHRILPRERESRRVQP